MKKINQMLTRDTHEYLNISGQDLFALWKNLNLHYAFKFDETFQHNTCDLGASRYGIILSSKTLDLPIPSQGDDHPLPYLDIGRRVKLLESRYVNAHLFQNFIIGLTKIAEKRRRKSYPTMVNLQFNRQGTNTPTGGGCLISLTLGWYQNKLHLTINSRAGEITKAFLGDLYLIKYLVSKACHRARLPIFEIQDADDLVITWQVILGVQSRIYLPTFLLYNKGEESVLEYMRHNAEGNIWREHVQWFFWTRFIFPKYHEKRKMSQRVSEAFLQDSTIDWQEERQRVGWEYKQRRRETLNIFYPLPDKMSGTISIPGGTDDISS